MPVTVSSFVLRWAIVHEGVIRLSDEEAVETIRRGTSLVVAKDGGILPWDRTDEGLKCPNVICRR